MRPNFLWITLEDTSPRLGCYGDPIAVTPNLDRIAAEGVRYPNAFATAGVCAPSRCAVITGMYQTSIGGHHMRTTHQNARTPELPTPYDIVPPPYVKAFPEYLRAAGYYCSNNDKTDYQFAAPATAWDDCSTTGHWRNREDGQPFFAVFNLFGTHESGMWEKDEPLVTDPDSVQLPPYLPDTPKSRRALARHYDNLAASDRRVGELLRELEEDGLDGNTIVMVWSDHGEGLPRAKRWTYDAGIRVPLLVKIPGASNAGTVNDRLVSMIDLGPTVLSLAGVAIPSHMQGQSFAGPMDAGERNYIYATRDRYDEAYDMVRSVRDRKFKYICNLDVTKPYLLWIPYSLKHPISQELWRLRAEGGLEGSGMTLFQSRVPEELYDCEADPHELFNLAHDPAYANVLARMRQALQEWRERCGDLGELPEVTMVRSMWPNGEQPVTAAPVAVVLSGERSGTEPIPQTEEPHLVAGPLMVMLHSATQGASIAYTTDEGEQPRWRLYTEPFRVPQGGKLYVRARAVRIGYQDSGVVSYRIRTH